MKKIIDKHQADRAGVPPAPRVQRPHNYDEVVELVVERVEKSQGRISAKRLLPIARCGLRRFTTELAPSGGQAESVVAQH